MNKIEFKDLPDTTTPFTASLFNDLQDNVQEAIDLTNTYSLSEIKIGSWLGKPLYRKVIDFGTLPNISSKSVSTGLSNIQLIKMTGIVIGNDAILNIPYISVADNAYNMSLVFRPNNNNIEITTTSDRSNYNAYITLEYTKTTDEVSEVS